MPRLIVWYTLFQCIKSLKMPLKNVYVMTKLVNISNDFCFGLSFCFAVVWCHSIGFWLLLLEFQMSRCSILQYIVSTCYYRIYCCWFFFVSRCIIFVMDDNSCLCQWNNDVPFWQCGLGMGVELRLFNSFMLTLFYFFRNNNWLERGKA